MSMGSEVEYFIDNKCTEMTLGITDGQVRRTKMRGVSTTKPKKQKIAIKSWGKEHAPIKILALHGYLDNAATYDRLAPLIVSNVKFSVRVVAMDFSGNGYSSYRQQPASLSYSM